MVQNRLARVGLVLAAGCIGCGGSHPAITAATTSAPPSTPVTPSSSPTAPTAVEFTVQPKMAQPGEVVELSGTACPPHPSWDAEQLGAFVVIGRDATGPAEPGVHPPLGGDGHLSFNLLPEYVESVAHVMPADDGTWRVSWRVPPDDATLGDEIWLSALCLVGPGLESGHVRYGSQSVAIAS